MYRVIESESLGEQEMLWEHEPQLFRVLPNFQECFYDSIGTRYMFSVSFRKYRDEEKEKQLVYFDRQNVNYLCSRHHYVNSSC